MNKFTLEEQSIKQLPRPGRELWVKVANAFFDEHESEQLAKMVAWNALKAAGFEKDKHKWNSPSEASLSAFSKDVHPFGGAPAIFVKAYTAGDKTRHVIVKASGLRVDKQDERMAPTAIDDMVQACKAGKVELLDNHFSSFEMGKSTDAHVADEDEPDSNIEKGDMLVDFALNKTHPNNDQLYEECEKGLCKRQASVGGNVTKAHFEYNEDLGKAVKVLDHVDLDHVAVTREDHSAYPTAEFVGAIMKQVHLAVPDFKKGGGTMKEFILKLEKLAAEAKEMMKGFFQITPEMLDDKFTLKAQFKEQLEKSAPKLSQEDKTKVAKFLADILRPLGIPTVFKEAGHWNDEHLKDLQNSHMAMGHAMKAAEQHVAEAGTSAFKEAMEHHEDMGKAIKKMIDSGTDKSGKEETRSGKKSKNQEDGIESTEADGPGSKEEHEGNGSAGAEKSLAAAANALVKKLREELEGKLSKANEAYEKLKSDSHVTSQQLTKAMLEVQELKKDLGKLGKEPVAPRPGAGVKVEKTDTNIPLGAMAVDALLKGAMGDPNGFMQKLETEVNQMGKMKHTHSWTPELQKEAERKAQILKDCKTMGAVAAMEKHGIKMEVQA